FSFVLLLFLIIASATAQPEPNYALIPQPANLIKKEGFFTIGSKINAHGRKVIGWDEILKGGLATDATVMSWRGEAGGIAAARQNHDVVMTPGAYCYFDHYQSDPNTQPPAIGGYIPLQKVYSYNFIIAKTQC